jgi:hypothetical protein
MTSCIHPRMTARHPGYYRLAAIERMREWEQDRPSESILFQVMGAGPHRPIDHRMPELRPRDPRAKLTTNTTRIAARIAMMLSTAGQAG